MKRFLFRCFGTIIAFAIGMGMMTGFCAKQGYRFEPPDASDEMRQMNELERLEDMLAQKRKELTDIQEKIQEKRTEFGVLEAKVETIKQLRDRMFFRMDFDIYVVDKGDTLFSIAKRLYGDGRKWVLLYSANRDIIDNPNTIYPDQMLIVPKLEGR